MALAGFPLRRPAIGGVRGRERVSHLHDAPEGQSAQRAQGLWKGAPQPRQEPDAHCLDHPRRWYGRVVVGGHRGGERDAEVFEAYVERFLAPTLEEGRVVVLDGLGAHRTGKVRDLIEAKGGAELVFLPSYYSPDLNPIEEALSAR